MSGKRGENKVQTMIRKDGNTIIPPSKYRYKSAKKDAIRFIIAGNSIPDTKEMIMQKYGYTQTYTDKLMTELNKDMDKTYEKWTNNIAKANIDRLTAIADEAFDHGDDELALKAVDLLNKTANVYQKNIQLTNEGKPVFEVKIGE